MGATQQIGSDRYAYTIIEVLTPKKIRVQADHQRCTSGNEYNSESQTWACERNPNGTVLTVTKRKNGRWVRQGDSKNGAGFGIGHRSPYRDPSF